MFGIAVGAAVVAWQAARAPDDAWALLPDNTGAIRTVELQYTVDAAEAALPCLRSFIHSLDPSVEVIAVCGDRTDASSFMWEMRNEPCTLRTVVVGKPITGWAKDRFLVAHGDPAALLCPDLPHEGPESRFNDSLVAPALEHAMSGRFVHRSLPLEFDAGDILASSDGVFVSDVLWNRNGRPAGFGTVLKGLFGRRVFWLRGAPDHHIGMFAAPIGDRRVMVGSPDLGRKLWPQGAKGFPEPDFSEETCRPFRMAEKQLKNAGFKVVRVPLVPFAPRVYMTYTNGVFETRDGGKIAYLPQYGLSEMDRPARRAFEQAGWKVRPVPVRTVYQHRGTIGCLVNVLERDGGEGNL